MKWKHENKYTLTHVMRYIVSRKKYTPGEYINFWVFILINELIYCLK